MAVDPATAEFYTTRAEEWAARLPQPYCADLPAFLALLPAGARILELGCGDGRDAAFMEAAGFAVDATDGVARMVELASARLQRPARLLEFAQLDADGEYDAVWAYASLLHADQAELPGILARVYRALRPGGWHYAAFKGGDGPRRDIFGRYYSFIPRAELEAVYATAGPWQGWHVETRMGSGFDGQPTPWHHLMARKPG